MPIVRTYQCGDCFHRIEVTLSAEQWDDPPPSCPACSMREMNQEFRPVAIRGVQANHRANAQKLAETIAVEDYGVADMNPNGYQGEASKHRLKDITPATVLQGGWGSVPGATGKTITVDSALMATAMAAGKQTRQEGGDGLDILQGALKSGAQPDLIEASKKRMMRVY
jgi:hypothetical protein